MAHDPSPQPTVCPSPQLLADFQVGSLPPDTSNEVSAHVSTCPNCQTLLRQTPATPTIAAPATDSIDSSGHETIDWTTDSFIRVIASVGEVSREVTGTIPVVRLGQYRLVRILGQGGMGAVCLGYHLSLKKWVAVKLLPRGATARPGAIARFKREMEAIGQLDHPNIVRATDAGEVDGVHYLVMELVDGADLNRLLREERTLTIPTACEMIRQAAAGLQYAHELGMVHRDIKPSNLILTRTGRVKILDLGLALIGGDRLAGSVLTGTGQVMGTLNYMAPEQWEAASKVDIRADIYSLGCTLYALLTGRAPFGGVEYDSVLQKMAAHAQAPIPRAATRRPEIPDALDDVITRMMAKSPADRYATPQEVALALEPFLTGENLSEVASRIKPMVTPEPPKDEPSVVSPEAQASTLMMPPVVSKKRHWLIAAVGVVFLSLATVIAVVAGLFHDRDATDIPPVPIPEPRPPIPPVTVVEINKEPPPRVWTPLVWHNLLDRKPVEFYWKNPHGVSSWHFDPDKRNLNIQCFGPGLLSLGNTEAHGYRLKVGIRQTHWVGGIGIFIGGQSDANRPAALKYQAVSIYSKSTSTGKNSTIHRAKGGISLRNVRDPITGEQPFGITTVDTPEGREMILDITVVSRKIREITWDGQRYTKLFDDSTNSLFTPKEHQGEFGVILDSATATILSAEFMPFDNAIEDTK
ncbi:serine/threonine protein kinase [Zavarzinella formosa]|uniref:serine/threonine protein kinase n=1 Tax=Zavarzinella formosa TaxID=360055 RepID=UPI0002E44671|nr:serine/threonine-protein kinase [Zavarzinella formosa]